jgi:hypothetical protein
MAVIDAVGGSSTGNAFFVRIRARRGHQIAAVAVARKLPVPCWHLFAGALTTTFSVTLPPPKVREIAAIANLLRVYRALSTATFNVRITQSSKVPCFGSRNGPSAGS